MRALHLASTGSRVSVLCLGAHSDDIEIGVGGTLLSLIARGVSLDVQWCVLSGSPERHEEARASAADFLSASVSSNVEMLDFKDGFFPENSGKIKSWFELLQLRCHPDVIFTHRRDDAHQDHREVCRMTWNTFRDHCILEYEVPKWDGDIGQPNLYVPVSSSVLERKIDLLTTHFGSQRSKHWFDGETFRGLARLRGLECRAPDGYAEGFFARKLLMT